MEKSMNNKTAECLIYSDVFTRPEAEETYKDYLINNQNYSENTADKEIKTYPDTAVRFYKEQLDNEWDDFYSILKTIDSKNQKEIFVLGELIDRDAKIPVSYATWVFDNVTDIVELLSVAGPHTGTIRIFSDNENLVMTAGNPEGKYSLAYVIRYKKEDAWCELWDAAVREIRKNNVDYKAFEEMTESVLPDFKAYFPV